jgi:hypothetical protein
LLCPERPLRDPLRWPIETNSITQAFDPACKRSVREQIFHFPDPQFCRGGR